MKTTENKQLKEGYFYYHHKNEYHGLTFYYKKNKLYCTNALLENGSPWEIIEDINPDEWVEIKKYEPVPLWNYSLGIDKHD